MEKSDIVCHFWKNQLIDALQLESEYTSRLVHSSTFVLKIKCLILKLDFVPIGLHAPVDHGTTATRSNV